MAAFQALQAVEDEDGPMPSLQAQLAQPVPMASEVDATGAFGAPEDELQLHFA